MAMSATLSRTSSAINGQPTNFVLAVSNSGGSPVNVESIQPIVTTSDGRPTTACAISGPYAPVGFGQAQVNGSQFNVQVPAAGTVNFLFQVTFFGPQVAGMPATPNPVYLVNANISASDDTLFSPGSPLLIALANPTWGRPGAPPPSPPVAPGGLDFSTPINSGLLL
jgi:hypothetical protein